MVHPPGPGCGRWPAHALRSAHRHIRHRLRRKTTASQIGQITPWPSVIGPEQTRIAKPLIHKPQVIRPREHVVVGIIGIGSQIELLPHRSPGARHELHEGHCASGTGDGTSTPNSLPMTFESSYMIVPPTFPSPPQLPAADYQCRWAT